MPLLQWPGKWKRWGVAVVCLCLFWFAWVAWHTRRRRWQRQQATLQSRQLVRQQCAQVPSDETIFVSIASYRDPACAATILSLLENAYCPVRVHVGVCQQNDPLADPGIIQQLKLLCGDGVNVWRPQLSILSLDAAQAQGPMHARALIETHLYGGQNYYLVCDSHMRFAKHWDVQLMEMLRHAQRQASNPVLSAYPQGYDHKDQTQLSASSWPATFLRFRQFHGKAGSSVWELEGPRCAQPHLLHPVPALFCVPTFRFSHADVIHRCPYESAFPYCFFGEDHLVSAQLWVAGYNFFTPSRALALHDWHRDRPTFWEQFQTPLHPQPVHHDRRVLARRSHKHLLRQLGWGSNNNDNNSNSIHQSKAVSRSLAQYMHWCGVNWLQGTVAVHARLGLPAQCPAHQALAFYGSVQGYRQARLQALRSIGSQRV